MSIRVKREKTLRFAKPTGPQELKRKLKIIFGAFSRLFCLPLPLSIPIMGYLFLGSVDFLTLLTVDGDGQNLFYNEGQPSIESEDERYAAELVKLKYYLYLYAYTSILLLFNFKAVIQQVAHHKNFVAIFIVLLLGYFVSDESDKVLTNVVHLGFGAASALLFSIGQLGKSTSLRNTYVVVLTPIFLIQAASIYLLISVDTGVVDFLADGKRYSGYAGNPNTLGGLCALGIWSAMSLMYESSSKHSFFLVILVALFAAGLVVTASTTATVVSIIVASILLWGMVLRRCTGLTRVIFNLLIVLVSVISALLFVVYIGDNYIELFTESVGREGTLSGRTELWSIAREAITEKPILGWSYDSHQSVFGFKLYAVPFNHYHNGYMDTLIAGGFVLGAFVIIHFIQFIRLYLSVSKVNKAVLPLLLPLVIILISNFTEYSLLRNNNPLWTTYMVAYFLLVTVFVRRDGAVPVVQPRQRRVLKKSRKQHFRF